MKGTKNFINEMKLRKIKRYKKPIMIVMNGVPGSGKTTLAKELSRDLHIFLLSNDYVRNYFFQLSEVKDKNTENEIQELVKKINRYRLLNLLLHRLSFVFDSDLNSLEKIELYKKISKIFRYELVTIKLLSNNDENNINRIQSRNLDYHLIDPSVIGDNVNFSGSYPKETYYEILERKPQTIPCDYFDYIIENDGSKDEFDNNVKSLVNDIKHKLKKIS